MGRLPKMNWLVLEVEDARRVFCHQTLSLQTLSLQTLSLILFSISSRLCFGDTGRDWQGRRGSCDEFQTAGCGHLS